MRRLITAKTTLTSKIMDDIRRVFKAVNDHSKKAECETGLASPQLWTIKVIAESSLTNLKDLASRIFVHPPRLCE